MGFALLLVGLLMVITGARGTYAQFGSQIASEFQGPNNFTYWLIAIGAVGAAGYIGPLQTVSRWLMTLIVLSIFLSHKGFFAQFQNALATGPKAPNALTQQQSNVNAVQSGAISPSQALQNQQSSGGVIPGFPSVPSTGWNAKFNSWMNYLFGTNQGTSQ